MWIARAALVVVVVVAACAAPAIAPDLPPGADAVVADVVDGDTLRMAGGERVRLVGIDAPESVKPHSPVECYGREASEHLGSLLPNGSRVRLVGDVEPRDRYGRLLAYVYRAKDALFVNAAMVRDGYAQPLTVPPNDELAPRFLAAARRARAARRGLWGRGACASADAHTFPRN